MEILFSKGSKVRFIVLLIFILFVGVMYQLSVWDLSDDIVTLELGENLSPADYLLGKDYILENVYIDDTSVDYSNVGEYTISYSRGRVEKELYVVIVDTIAPEVELNNNALEYVFEDGYILIDIYDYIDSIVDNDSDLNFNIYIPELDRTITSYKFRLYYYGDYTLEIEISDNSGNTTEFELYLNASIEYSDQYKGVENITMYVGDEVDLLENIEYTKYVLDVTVDDSDVDYTKADKYVLSYTFLFDYGYSETVDAVLVIEEVIVEEEIETINTTVESTSSSTSGANSGGSSNSSSNSSSSSTFGANSGGSSNSSSNSSSSSTSSNNSGSSSSSTSKYFFSVEGDISDSVQDLAYTYWLKVPSNLREAFIADGWTLLLTDKDIAQTYYSGTTSSTFSGLCSYTKKTIYIKGTSSGVEVSLIHEFGHFLDYMTGYVSHSVAWSNLYEAEKSGYVGRLNSSSYGISNTSEFWASIFDIMIMSPSTVSSTTPDSAAYIQMQLDKVYNGVYNPW